MPSKTSTSTAPSMISVQTGQHTFMGDYVRPGCPPTLPAEYKFSHRVVQKHDGSWCFLPLIYDTIPESWYSTSENRNAPIESESPEAAPKVSKTVNQSAPALEYSEIGHSLTEDVIEESASADDPPHPARKISQTTKTQEAKNTGLSDHKPALRSAEVITGSPKTRFSDHPITGSLPRSPNSLPKK